MLIWLTEVFRFGGLLQVWTAQLYIIIVCTIQWLHHNLEEGAVISYVLLVTLDSSYSTASLIFRPQLGTRAYTSLPYTNSHYGSFQTSKSDPPPLLLNKSIHLQPLRPNLPQPHAPLSLRARLALQTIQYRPLRRQHNPIRQQRLFQERNQNPAYLAPQYPPQTSLERCPGGICPG